MIVDILLPEATEFELILDDTLNSHVGKKICGAGSQHDGDAPKTGKPIGYGVCFVIIGVAVRLPGISDGVFCLPYAPRLWWPRKAKVKPVGTKHKTKSELGAELISLSRSWLDPSVPLRVIVDGGYSNKQLIQDRPKGVHITGKVRVDAALYPPVEQGPLKGRGRPRKKGKRLPTPRSLFDGYWGPQWEWSLQGRKVDLIDAANGAYILLMSGIVAQTQAQTLSGEHFGTSARRQTHGGGAYRYHTE